MGGPPWGVAASRVHPLPPPGVTTFPPVVPGRGLAGGLLLRTTVRLGLEPDGALGLWPCRLQGDERTLERGVFDAARHRKPSPGPLNLQWGRGR
jgi:hypothetical protein